MQGMKRKVVYASLFELIAIGLTSSLLKFGVVERRLRLELRVQLGV